MDPGVRRQRQRKRDETQERAQTHDSEHSHRLHLPVLLWSVRAPHIVLVFLRPSRGPIAGGLLETSTPAAHAVCKEACGLLLRPGTLATPTSVSSATSACPARGCQQRDDGYAATQEARGVGKYRHPLSG